MSDESGLDKHSVWRSTDQGRNEGKVTTSVPSAAVRKMRHVEACLGHPVQYDSRTTGFEKFDLPYVALPETDLSQIDTRTNFLGRPLRAPVLIGAMTGGTELAATINRNLAVAADHLGLGLMLGSQRIMVDDATARSSFEVRKYAADALLVGNLGLAQLNSGYTAAQARLAVELVGADALAFHTNPLQEAMQSGGDGNFRSLVSRLAEVVDAVPFPVLLKEVGHGIGAVTAGRLGDVALAAVDVAGAGGTSWSRVEQYVAHGEVRHHELAEWGIPTMQALCEVKQVMPRMPLIASGGIRSGVDAAKAIALGASVVAVALPLLEPATRSPEAVIGWLERFLWELRVAMHCAGCANLAELSAVGRLQPRF
ncbi:type 2 isopentenyl-diphosphate Delta-isomerase [Micromonospora sp. WMMD1120]|uniref:type 2 isopentenyl-diphosphate Delta-isomerase n=1 Tax=Micromonospora sp. WMMD1120 TaxID=3016106 RepID=UPI0024169C72|nr:type 2 isopentenyl-diphosphate Delta-isomerase [Micromonospora sp. WMMD1120]MDG4808725.1 type 2 isopentenyl-diphosphate Delta-isomerase [Micromonospora sp. WMMD1120]